MKIHGLFFLALGCKNSRRLHVGPSLGTGGNDMKLFHFSSMLGQFKASLVNSAYVPSPFPYLQDHLYNVSQPGKNNIVVLTFYLGVLSGDFRVRPKMSLI
jgi:hypothetical protein